VKTPEDMQVLADEYFALCDEKEVPYTVPGVCDHLGFSCRQSLWDYSVRFTEYSDTIKRIRQRIERQRVEKMLTGKQNIIASIFDLKNNFGYVDKHEHEHAGNQPQITIVNQWTRPDTQSIDGQVIDDTPSISSNDTKCLPEVSRD